MAFRRGTFESLPFSRLLKILDLRGENCLHMPIFTSKKGPVWNALWTGPGQFFHSWDKEGTTKHLCHKLCDKDFAEPFRWTFWRDFALSPRLLGHALELFRKLFRAVRAFFGFVSSFELRQRNLSHGFGVEAVLQRVLHRPIGYHNYYHNNNNLVNQNCTNGICIYNLNSIPIPENRVCISICPVTSSSNSRDKKLSVIIMTRIALY